MIMINELAFIQRSMDEMYRIAKNEPNPEKAKLLIKQFLMDQKRKVPEDLKL